MSSPACNIDAQEVLQKVYEIVQLVQTLRLLVGQLNQLCVNGALRLFFGFIFYFTPQLNPFVWSDAYEAIKRQRETPHASQDLRTASKANIGRRSSPPASGVDGPAESQAQASPEPTRRAGYASGEEARPE